MTKQAQKKRTFFNRGVYLLPNLFTTLAMAFGFLSIYFAIDGRFEQAGMFIFIAGILDALDGRVARMTNTQTEFGAELDSLSDMVSFGVAPAILAYSWNLNEYGKFGAMITFIYALCVAVRLARFNVTQTSGHNFVGLPSPAAAVALTAPIWYLSSVDISGDGLALISLTMFLIITPLTVSLLSYPSFKKIGFRKVVSFWQASLFLFVLISIVVEPTLMIMVYSWIYILFALVSDLFKNRTGTKEQTKQKQKQKRKKSKNNDSGDESQ